MDIAPQFLIQQMSAWRLSSKSWNPHPYQGLGLKYVLEDPQSGLFLDPGMGKTSIMLAMMKILRKKRMARRALVIAPMRPMYQVWPKEMREWNDFHELGIAILHGDKKEQALRNLTDEHAIAVINPEGLDWLFDGKARVKMLDADVLIIDESSKFKNSDTVRFRRLKNHLVRFRRRHILTGSPRPRNYLDLFGQIYILDRGATLGPYVSHYRNRFFYSTGYEGYEWALLPDSEKQINKLVAPLVLRLDSEDYLKMPALPDPIIHRVEMPAKARDIYDQLEMNMIVELFENDDRPIVATSVAGVRSKLAQMANGRIYNEVAGYGPRSSTVLHTAKVDAFKDLYDELQGDPLLCAIGYKHDITAIREALNYDVPCINSDTSKRDAMHFENEWNAGRLPLLSGHPASMGHGLNLQGCGCRHVACFDINDDYDLYDQFFRRVWRQGNKAGAVWRHIFMTTSTVDEAKWVNLTRKGNGQRSFLQAMKEYAVKKGLLKQLAKTAKW